MHLELEYTVGAEEHLAHEEFKSGRKTRRPNYFKPRIPLFALCGLGAMVSYKAHNTHLLVIFLFVAAVYAVDATTKTASWKPSLATTMAQLPSVNIRLVIDDQGLRETVEQQVVSFAPWSAVKSYVQLEKIWALNLVGGYTALIPTAAIGEAQSNLHAELKARSIPQLVRDHVF